MRFAYADPPYVGQAAKHYDSPEVDHVRLLERLYVDYPDGWALSCTSVSLPYLLYHAQRILPPVRIGAWVKPFCSFKPGVGVAYAWEPVIFLGGRPRTREQPTVRDFVSANILLKRGLSGTKPDEFCYWLFDLLNLEPADDLDDLYPGTGRVGRAWQRWRAYKADVAALTGAPREPHEEK